jgi:hypothetical protein
MICGYENTYDFCKNGFSYTYASIIDNNGSAFADTGVSASVYKQNLLDNSIVLLTPDNNAPIETCDIEDEQSTLNNWDCYRFYVDNGGEVKYPDIEEYRLAQRSIIETRYKALLDTGISVTINNFITNIVAYNEGAYSNISPEDLMTYTIHLPADEEDIINFSNILSQATLIHESQSTSKLIPILDYINNTHFLNYLNLSNILVNYFNKIKQYTTIKNNLLNSLITASSVTDIQSLTYYGNKPPSNLNITTNISAANTISSKFNTLDCI